MTTSRKTTEAIRQFILQNIEAYPQNISSIVAEMFSISRQAANRHVASLVSKGFLQASGSTRNRRYILRFLINQTFTWAITTELEEHIIWRTSIYPLLKDIAPP